MATNKRQKVLFEEYGVETEDQLEKILKDDWKTIPCQGNCGTPIFVEHDEIVWIYGDPYHKGCG